MVAETCLRGLVLAAPDHRKVLAMTIFEQYVLSMNDLAGLFLAFRNREQAPIMKSFLEFRLDAPQRARLLRVGAVRGRRRALQRARPADAVRGRGDARTSTRRTPTSVALRVYHLVKDLRKATDQGTRQRWRWPSSRARRRRHRQRRELAERRRVEGLTPDQVAMLVLDSKRRSLYRPGLTAEEGAMAQVIDAIDTVTRAGSEPDLRLPPDQRPVSAASRPFSDRPHPLTPSPSTERWDQS